MEMSTKLSFLAILMALLVTSCDNDDDDNDNQNPTPATTECENTANVPPLDDTRGDCNQTLTFANQYNEQTQGGNRIISANSIPDHQVGLFGGGMGSLNPNAISPQTETYTIPLNPTQNAEFTQLLSTDGQGPNAGPQYSFGILMNGVELDPIAAEPWPHEGIMGPDINWEWNLEASNVNLGLDCNNAHVQPTGKYHYHGSPTLYLENINAPANQMTLVGYAADGFPIYFKYAYSDPNDENSPVEEMLSGYTLKSGDRPGDGIEAPCGEYNGVYSNDYEYLPGNSDLDEANGRTGVTPQFPNGTYYYVITEDFPIIPRMLRGTPSADFEI